MNMGSSTVFHPKLTECKQCNLFDYSVNYHPLYNECHVLQCRQCCTQWYVCKKHNKRFNLQNMAKLRNHFIHEHKENFHMQQNNYNHDENVVNDLNSFETIIYDFEETTDTLCHTHKKPKLDETLTETQQQAYADSNFNTSHDVLNRVIGTAFSNNPVCPLNISKEEIAFHLNITNFCTKLSESQQYQLTDIIHQLMSNNFVKTRPPTSFHDLQKFYLSGKHSIYKNIPCPVVTSFDNHACVALPDVVTFALATLDNLSIVQSSNYINIIEDNSSIIHTKICKTILHTINTKHKLNNIDPYVIFVTFWSDDFEVNHTRRNRNSTWIKTMTLIGSKETNTSRFYTQLVAIGNKGINHDNVNARLNNELLLLQNVNYYYLHKYKKTLPVVIYPIAILADRPERCALNATLSFSGNTTRRWLYSSLVPPNKLASCKACTNRRINRYLNKITSPSTSNVVCGRCCDFDFNTTSKAADFVPPHNYPKTKHIDSPPFPVGRDVLDTYKTQHLRPIKLTYEILKSGTRAAAFNLITNHWKKSEIRSYLKTLGVSTMMTDRVIAYALQEKNDNVDLMQYIQALPLPHTWVDNVVPLDQFIETPMHHLFEGIVKALIEVTTDYLKFYKCWTKYCEHINPLLDDINSLRLEFCNIEPFWQSKTEYKATGWIAENYLGYARIVIVLLCHIENVIPHEKKAFLEFKCMLQTSFVLITHLMTRESVDIKNIENLVKIFLSSCQSFDIAFGYSETNIPFWYKKSNFVSLLNLPQQIDSHGPVYLYWEGVKERYIQYVKPLLKNKRKSVTYLYTKFKQLLQNNALEIHKDCYERYTSKSYKRLQNIYVYTNVKQLQNKIMNDETVSIIMMKNDLNRCWAIVKSEDAIWSYPISFNDNNGFHRCNLWFAPIQLQTEQFRPYNIINDIDLLNIINGMMVSLPKTKNENITHSGYTLLLSNWLVRTQFGTLDLPTITREIINIDQT